MSERRLIKRTLRSVRILTSRRMADSQADRSDGEMPSTAASPPRAESDDSVVQPIVFVIDDDESVRHSLERLFRSVKLDVQTFGTAREFLVQIVPDRPACLVLDLRLPDQSGLALQESLLRSGRDVPIIFISGHADVPSSVQAIKAGAVDFLQKPFSDQELLDTIHGALLRDHRARRRRAEIAGIRLRFDTLSRREREVLALIMRGRINRQIGEETGISDKTVKFHRGRVMKKMRAGSLAELVRQVDRLGFPSAAGRERLPS